MPIIVAGKLIIKSGSRDKFIEKSCEAIMQARNNKACIDFSVSSDPIDIDRINIFEKWESNEALNDFRESGPNNGMFELVTSFDINEYEVNT